MWKYVKDNRSKVRSLYKSAHFDNVSRREMAFVSLRQRGLRISPRMSAARPPAGDQQEVCTCETGEGLQQCKQITRSGSRKASVERSTQRQLQNGGLPEVCVPRTA